MEHLTIGAVARQAGLRTSALRYYESVGLLPPPARINGHRRYDPGVLQRLAVIQFAQQAGFTVAEIRTLLEGFAVDTPPSARWRMLAQQKLPEVERLIRRAQEMKRVLEKGLACACLQFDDCVMSVDEGCISERETRET